MRRFTRFLRADSAPGISDPYRGDDGLWRIDNVPICSTGIEYPLSSGPHTFTEGELAAAVRAASGADVAINAPRIKLGHKSSANALFLGGDEPAFGRVEAMRLTDNGQTILGDLVGIPEWLGRVLPTAYPSRSVDATINAQTVTGKVYEMVVTDLSLLGVRWPGCSTLEDLPLWYGGDTPAGVEIEAAADVVNIRRQFYTDGPGSENDWWIRGERFDSRSGYNLIIDQGNGEISRIPVAVDGDVVVFGDAVPVVEDYPDKALAAAAALRGMQLADPAMVIHATRADTAPANNDQGDSMDEEMRRSLALRLGLDPNATEEQIRAELARDVNEDPPPGGGDGDEDDDDGDDEDGDESEGDEEEAGTGTPAGGSRVHAETVTLDRATYDRLMSGAQLAEGHEQERVAGRIKAVVDSAVKDGRIPPARRKHWTKALTADFDGSKAVIESLEPGLVPVSVRGHSGGGDGDDGDITAEAGQGLPEEWFPEIKTIRANAASGRRVVNAREG